MQPTVVPKSMITLLPRAELDSLVIIPQADVSSGQIQDTFSVQVARHRARKDIFYGVSPSDVLAPVYVYHSLHEGQRPVTQLYPSHLDLIIAGIIFEGFGTRVTPREARDMNYGLYQTLYRGLKHIFH